MSMRISSVSNQTEEQKHTQSVKGVRQSELLRHLSTQQLRYFNRESLRQGVKKLQPHIRRLQHLQYLKKKADEYSNKGQYLKDCLNHILNEFHYYRDIKSKIRNQDLYLAIMVNFIEKAIEGGQNCLHDLLQIVNESVAVSKFMMGSYKSIILGFLKQLYYTLSDYTQQETLILFYEMLLYEEEFHCILSQVAKSMVVHFYKRVHAQSSISRYPSVINETKIENYFQQFVREERFDNIILHTLACLLRINIQIYDFSNSGGPIGPGPLLFNRGRLSSMLDDSHLSLLNFLQNKTISILRYQANEFKRYAVLYEFPNIYPLAQEIYKQWNIGVISHVVKIMLPFKQFTTSSYMGTANVAEQLNDSSSIGRSELMEEAVLSQIQIALQCGHSFSKRELRNYLESEFIHQDNELNPRVFFKISYDGREYCQIGKSRPACKVCQTFMTYQDFQTIFDRSLLDEKFFAFIEKDWNQKDLEVKAVPWPEMKNSQRISSLSNPYSTFIPNSNERLLPLRITEEDDIVPPPKNKCTKREKFLIAGFSVLLVIVIALVVLFFIR